MESKSWNDHKRFQVAFNKDCPTWGWMKWSFNGPMLVVHKPFVQMCLECRVDERASVVGTTRCTGSRNQQWHFDMYHDRRTQQGDISFTINSSLYPNQCLTIDDASESKSLVLRNCTASVQQLFYLNRDWFETAIASQAIVDSSRGLKMLPASIEPVTDDHRNS